MNISIVTVTYNAAHTVQRTLDSVASQKDVRFEHLIIDGGSNDATVEIINNYKSANPQSDIVIVSEPDKGLYDAMNKGLQKAKGQFVCFLNAGDKLHDDTVLSSVNAIIDENTAEGRQVAVVYGETDIVDDEGTFLSHRRLKTPEKLTWKSFKNGMLVCHQSFYARKDIAPLYDLAYRFSADFDWCVKVMKKGQENGMSLVNSHKILTDYLSEGMTTQNHKKSLKERFNIMRKHYGLFSTICYHAWFFIRNLIK